MDKTISVSLFAALFGVFRGCFFFLLLDTPIAPLKPEFSLCGAPFVLRVRPWPGDVGG